MVKKGCDNFDNDFVSKVKADIVPLLDHSSRGSNDTPGSRNNLNDYVPVQLNPAYVGRPAGEQLTSDGGLPGTHDVPHIDVSVPSPLDIFLEPEFLTLIVRAKNMSLLTEEIDEYFLNTFACLKTPLPGAIHHQRIIFDLLLFFPGPLPYISICNEIILPDREHENMYHDLQRDIADTLDRWDSKINKFTSPEIKKKVTKMMSSLKKSTTQITGLSATVTEDLLFTEENLAKIRNLITNHLMRQKNHLVHPYSKVALRSEPVIITKRSNPDYFKHMNKIVFLNYSEDAYKTDVNSYKDKTKKKKVGIETDNHSKGVTKAKKPISSSSESSVKGFISRKT